MKTKAKKTIEERVTTNEKQIEAAAKFAGDHEDRIRKLEEQIAELSAAKKGGA